MSQRNEDLIIASALFLDLASVIKLVVAETHGQWSHHTNRQHHVSSETFLKTAQNVWSDRPR
jgi:hypothetical protein